MLEKGHDRAAAEQEIDRVLPGSQDRFRRLRRWPCAMADAQLELTVADRPGRQRSNAGEPCANRWPNSRRREAWLPFEPTAEQPFDRRLAAHLFRRAGFGGHLPRAGRGGEARSASAVKGCSPRPKRKTAAFDEEMHKFAQVTLAANNPELLSGWWLHRMRHTPAPLLEKMTLFWHGHFATSAAKVTRAAS